MKSTFFRPRPLTFQAFLLLASVCGGGAALAGQKDAVAAETIVLPGLREPVEILVDRWGVPHIYAKNEADLFFAQGATGSSRSIFGADAGWANSPKSLVPHISNKTERHACFSTVGT